MLSTWMCAGGTQWGQVPHMWAGDEVCGPNSAHRLAPSLLIWLVGPDEFDNLALENEKRASCVVVHLIIVFYARDTN